MAETLTQALTSGMTVSAAASGPDDQDYSVTCQATLNLSDGTSFTSNTASDVFLVSDMTVNITGPAYVIVDNSNPYDNAPVESDYTATVDGDPNPGSLTYNWVAPQSINILVNWSNYQPATIDTDGQGPPGAATIDCNVYDAGTNQTGYKPVTVQDEFVVTETSSNVPGQMSSPLLAQFGPFNNGGSTSATVQVSRSSTVSQTVTVGFTESAGAADGVIDANFGLSAQTRATVSGTVSVDTTLTIPPMTSDTLQEFPATDTDSGKYQIWGTSGLAQSGNWVYVQLAPGPMPAAQTIVQKPYSPS